MKRSTHNLNTVLNELRQAARVRGLNDSDWAKRAGLRKETLSRLRRRKSCDFSPLLTLAEVVDAHIGVLNVAAPDTSPDGHFPVRIDPRVRGTVTRFM